MNKEWLSLIPKPDFKKSIKHKNGNTQNIIDVLLDAYKYNNYQGAREMKEVANALRESTPLETLRNVWNFVHSEIKYKADEPGNEVIKNPAVLAYYGVGDCKSFSLMIASILHNYDDIGFSFRFVKYEGQSNYSHVYIVAKIKSRRSIVIMDATYTDFDLEASGVVQKKDYEMTMISHIYGPNNKNRNSIHQAYNDSPLVAVSPVIEDISKYTQGQLKLQLIKNNLIIQENYYGDPNKVIAKAKSLIDSALKDLANFQVIGAVDSIHNGILANIEAAKVRHIKQVVNVEQLLPVSGISGKDRWSGLMKPEDLKKCIDQFKPETANSWHRGFHDYVQYYDSATKEASFYKISDDKFKECLDLKKQGEWSRNNIFEKLNFKKGAITMLYEFIKIYKGSRQLNSKGDTKSIIHQSFVDAFGYVSGLDRDNVSLYVKNGISYTSALNKLPDISPEYAIQTLAEGYQHKGQPGINELATTIAIITAISSGIAAIIAAMKEPGPNFQTNLNAMAKGLLGESTKPSIDDFGGSSNNYLLPLGLLAAGGAIYFLTSSKKQK